MTEYIEKNALYKKVAELEELARNRYLDTPSNSPAYSRYVAQLDERTRFKHMVYDFPAADVAEVKHGKWTSYGADKRGRGGIWVCSACNDAFPYTTHYCPNCGAKMKEDENE